LLLLNTPLEVSIRKGEYLFKQKPVEYDVKLELGVNY